MGAGLPVACGRAGIGIVAAGAVVIVVVVVTAGAIVVVGAGTIGVVGAGAVGCQGVAGSDYSRGHCCVLDFFLDSILCRVEIGTMG